MMNFEKTKQKMAQATTLGAVERERERESIHFKH